jgi:hypothetical protein
MKKKIMKIAFSKIPLSSSLGLLAFGDLAFTAWRKAKKEHKEKVDGENEKETK